MKILVTDFRDSMEIKIQGYYISMLSLFEFKIFCRKVFVGLYDTRQENDLWVGLALKILIKAIQTFSKLFKSNAKLYN